MNGTAQVLCSWPRAWTIPHESPHPISPHLDHSSHPCPTFQMKTPNSEAVSCWLELVHQEVAGLDPNPAMPGCGTSVLNPEGEGPGPGRCEEDSEKRGPPSGPCTH